MSKSIFNAQYAGLTDLESQAKHAFEFMIKYSNDITLDAEGYSIIANSKSLSRTPISEIFTRLVNEDLLKMFYFMDFSDLRTASVPEILMMEQIIIDGVTLKTCPDNLQKIWINVTPYLFKKKTSNEPIRIGDIQRMYNTIVLGALCASYNDSDAWLTPSLAAITIKVYSTVIAVLLQISYNLSMVEFKTVQTFFAAYYAKLLGSQRNNDSMPYLLNRCSFLGTMTEISDRLQLLFEKDKEINIKKICATLRTNGPGKMRTFTEPVLFRLFAMSAADNQTMLISLDYPPYFVHAILKNLSGFKNPIISNTVKKIGLKKDLDKFVQDLTISSILTKDIKR